MEQRSGVLASLDQVVSQKKASIERLEASIGDDKYERNHKKLYTSSQTLNVSSKPSGGEVKAAKQAEAQPRATVNPHGYLVIGIDRAANAAENAGRHGLPPETREHLGEFGPTEPVFEREQPHPPALPGLANAP